MSIALRHDGNKEDFIEMLYLRLFIRRFVMLSYQVEEFAYLHDAAMTDHMVNFQKILIKAIASLEISQKSSP